jgi:hypothetical protein
MFFRNLAYGKDLKDCAISGPSVDVIDALTFSIPVIIKYSDAERDLRNSKVIEVIKVTRNISTTEPYAIVFADFLIAILNGADLRTECLAAAAKMGLGDVEQQAKIGIPMAPCPIEKSFPALLVAAYMYADSVEQGILGNANAGGENIGRGGCLGALLGAYHGLGGFPAWTDGLLEKDSILKEIEELVRD